MVSYTGGSIYDRIKSCARHDGVFLVCCQQIGSLDYYTCPFSSPIERCSRRQVLFARYGDVIDSLHDTIYTGLSTPSLFNFSASPLIYTTRLRACYGFAGID